MKPEEFMTQLDALYAKVLEGIGPGKQGVVELAEAYLSKSPTVDAAALKLMEYQISKCAATGFVTGLGGLATLVVSIPVNVAAVLYFQLRMVAAVAYMGGHDVYSPKVRLLAYGCLAGVSLESMLKGAGIKIGTRVTKSVAARLPARITASVNKMVGYRLFTKVGTRSGASLGKMVPVVGGVVCGSLDYVETRLIAQRAYTMFIAGGEDNAAHYVDFEVVEEG